MDVDCRASPKAAPHPGLLQPPLVGALSAQEVRSVRNPECLVSWGCEERRDVCKTQPALKKLAIWMGPFFLLAVSFMELYLTAPGGL